MSTSWSIRGLMGNMMRPWIYVGRDSLACRLVGRSLPHECKKTRRDLICQAPRYAELAIDGASRSRTAHALVILRVGHVLRHSATTGAWCDVADRVFEDGFIGPEIHGYFDLARRPREPFRKRQIGCGLLEPDELDVEATERGGALRCTPRRTTEPLGTIDVACTPTGQGLALQRARRC